MNDIHDLAAFYVLGALDEVEAGRFEAHLDGCEPCRLEIGVLSKGVDVLAASVAEPAPAELRRSVLDNLDRDPGVVPLRRRRPVVAFAAVAAIVAFVFGVGLVRTTPQERLDDLLAARDVQTISQTGPISVEVVFSAERGTAALVAESLPPVEPDQTYELWLIGEEGPVPAGLFVPNEDGRVIMFLEGDPRPGQVVGLTVEPAGGSDAPTGEILAALEI